MNKTTSNEVMKDKFGRSFPYLRLSITDICNFSCSYCLPDGYKPCGKNNFLQQDEIKRLIDVFSELGTNKIRITGGEPTVRKDFIQIAELISSNNSIKQIAFTTNGYRLKENAKKWFNAGLTNINISVDSLNPQKFADITGHNRLKDIMDGIDFAIESGFNTVKINVVLLKNVNDNEIDDYLEWAKNSPITIRFIELMQTGDNLDYFKKYHLSADFIEKKLVENNWVIKTSLANAGPAKEYINSNYAGSVGVISPYSKDFCKSCNRLRVTSSGDLRLCLFGDRGISLRHLLQNDEDKTELKKLITTQLGFKCSSHFLEDGNTGITPHLASLGG